MKKTLAHLISAALCLAGATFAQENYANWKYYRFITVNTTSAGANVLATQANFPLLVRLNASNFTFAHAKGNGADIRFTDVTGATRYKHQIESWDSTNGTAAVWVLVPSIVGNNTTTLRVTSFRSVAADSSNGPAVFSTANNFQGVFHLSEATGDTARDATSNGFKAVARNRGGTNPTDTLGLIGHAKKFLGDISNNNGGSYQILTSTGGTTFTKNALNFQNDSSTAGGNGQPLYTISAWVNVNQFPYSTSALKGIVAKSAGTTATTQYCLRLKDPAINQVTTPVGDTMRVEFIDPIPAVYKSGINPISTGNWYHVAAVRSGARGTDGTLRTWINGYAPPAGAGITSTSITSTVEQALNVYIGSFSNDSGYFPGKIDEVEFSSVARDSNWLMLAYQTQKPATAAISIGAEQTNPDPVGTLVYPAPTLNLIAGTVMAVDSPSVIGGAATSFSVSPALPAGLTLNTTTGLISGTPTTNVAVATASYTVTANGAGGSTSQAVLSITVLTPPLITSNPIATSARLNPGVGVAKFGIKATGSATLVYKWVRTRVAATDTLANGGTAPAAIFSGATTDTLTITNAPFADSLTTYKCVVRNSAGQAVSTPGTLIVGSVVGIWAPKVVRVTGSANPFSFRIPAGSGVSSVRMTVENMGGRVVWTKDYKVSASGQVSWNGGGSDGRPVASGMYVVKMKMLTADNGSLGENVQTGINAK